MSDLVCVSQIDRIDAKYFAMSDRVKLGDETRLKATAEEAAAWEKRVTEGGGKLPLEPYQIRIFI